MVWGMLLRAVLCAQTLPVPEPDICFIHTAVRFSYREEDPSSFLGLRHISGNVRPLQERQGEEDDGDSSAIMWSSDLGLQMKLGDFFDVQRG